MRELVFLSSSSSSSPSVWSLTTRAATLSELELGKTGARTLLARGAVAGGEGCWWWWRPLTSPELSMMAVTLVLKGVLALWPGWAGLDLFGTEGLGTELEH